ncbi:MAG: zinc ribbon domain-containing protein [Azoarcus sp.]|jgi:hypothetical protein|nr:zinc ribbon domain-containing protein [Azoarcus sp.]
MNHKQPVPRSRHADLLRAVEALRNEKALFVLLATGLLAGASIFLMYSLHDSGAFTSIVLSAFVFLLLPVGASAAGLLLLDQAKGLTPRPLGSAVPGGLFAALRLLVIFLANVAVMAVFYLCLSLLLFACKIPFLGPALYAVLFPILAMAAGLLCLGLFAAQSMAGPAIWNGATVSETLSMLVRIATRRGAELLVSLFLLAALVTLAEFVLFGIVAIGAQTVLGASVSILGSSFQNPAGFPGLGIIQPIAANEYAQAIAFGAMLITVLVLTAVMALALMGLNLIYLRIAGDPALAGTDSPNALDAPPPPGPGKAQEALPPPFEARAAVAAANPADKPAAHGVPDILAGLFPEAAPSAAAPPSACPHCRAAIQPGDHYCGECGGKITG